MSKEIPTDDPRQKTDWGSLKQTDKPWKGPPEKEQKPSDHTPDLEKWQETHTHKGEATMAVNKPVGDNARKGAVKKRTQSKNPLTKSLTKRNKVGVRLMAVKKSAKKFKGVRPEK
jgi:hypothetical protein